MFVENLCSPAILYLGFSLTQIVIDLFRKMYNTAIIKMAITMVFTLLLNMLCVRGLSVISWIIVFIPFISMTLITGLVMYSLGLSPYLGKMDYSKMNIFKKKNPAVDRSEQEKKVKEVEQQKQSSLTDEFIHMQRIAELKRIQELERQRKQMNTSNIHTGEMNLAMGNVGGLVDDLLQRQNAYLDDNKQFQDFMGSQ